MASELHGRHHKDGFVLDRSVGGMGRQPMGKADAVREPGIRVNRSAARHRYDKSADRHRCRQHSDADGDCDDAGAAGMKGAEEGKP